MFAFESSAQRVRFSDSYVVPNAQIAPRAIGTTGTQQSLPQLQNPFPVGQPGVPQSVVGQPNAIQSGPQLTIPQGTIIQSPIAQPNLQQPAFDPFAVQQPPLPTGGVPNALPGSTLPPTSIGVLGVPNGGQQSIMPPPYIYPPPATAPGLQVSPYGYPVEQSNGSWSNSPSAWPNQAWARLRSSEVYRLLERPRWRHLYMAADKSAGSKGLGLHESDIAMTFSFPNFFYSGQPVRVSPGFIFHWWDGPNTATTGADLPARTYSAYLASDFTTPWDRPLGAELNFTVGVYSDFSETNSKSLRFTGVGLGWFRVNNTTTFKLGIEYLDRVRVKLLPAVGFFIYPTPDLKLDLYFPRPKLAQRLPNLGNNEVWAYIGGEYGAGSWTIKRMAGFGDQADVNDIRVFLGLEWVGSRRVTGLFEVGYVFDREIVYRSDPGTRFNIDDTIMLRAGIAF